MSTHQVATANVNTQTTSRTGQLVQALTAMCCGLLIVGFVGFSHLEAVHNAAHDTRHANAFPCH